MQEVVECELFRLTSNDAAFQTGEVDGVEFLSGVVCVNERSARRAGDPSRAPRT